MTEDVRDARKGKGTLRTIGELGPAWISAMGGLIVALTGAGFIAGHITASKTPAPQVTVTVTKTLAAAAGATNSPGATSPTSTSANVAAASNGSVLGHYSINVGFGVAVPLGPTKPTQSDFNSSGVGDLGTAAPADHLVFVPLNSERMVGLPAGTQPTYQACSTQTVFASQADSVEGTSFCIIESGRLAGIYVTSAATSYSVLDVTIWQYSS